MSDGRFVGAQFQGLQQAGLSRERYLVVNTGAVKTSDDASAHAAQDPTDKALCPNPDNAPHFILSPETPDGRPTLGFEFFLAGLVGVAAVAGVAGFTVTIWKLAVNLQLGNPATFGPLYSSFTPKTGVGFKEQYHSFDCNAAALRFQIVPDYVGGGTDGSVMIILNEL